VAPEKLGFNTDVEEEFYPDLTWEFLSKIPLEMAGIAALMGGVYYFRKKRLDAQGAKKG
jgi:formate dehydrogenase iron-sulfur subunit